MFYFPNHNKEVVYRLLGRQVIELHRILLLGDIHPQDFFSLSLFPGRRRPASISFHTVARFMHSWMCFPRGGGYAAFKGCSRALSSLKTNFYLFTKQIFLQLHSPATKWRESYKHMQLMDLWAKYLFYMRVNYMGVLGKWNLQRLTHNGNESALSKYET